MKNSSNRSYNSSWLIATGIVILAGWYLLFNQHPAQNNKSSVYIEPTVLIDHPRISTPSSINIDPPTYTDTTDYAPLTFHGYTCTQDCSGHEAGYNWAENKGITDPDDCGGNSNSFIEGCRSYAEEN